MVWVHRAFAAVLAACVFVAIAGQASATTVNFDDLSNGDVVGATYSGLGVTFVDAVVTNTYGARSGATSPNGVTHVNGFEVSQTDPIEATFSAAVTSVSIAAFDVGSGGVILKAFDAAIGGTLVDSVQASGGGDNVILTVSDPNILRVEFSRLTDVAGDGIAFDNFIFEPAVSPVPLPTALPLFLAALASLGFFGWRKGRKDAAIA